MPKTFKEHAASLLVHFLYNLMVGHVFVHTITIYLVGSAFLVSIKIVLLAKKINALCVKTDSIY
jgi:hypothetical protein